MADGLWLGMNGAAARAAQLDGVADNLANAQTVGFKAARARFEAFLPPSGGAAHPAAVSAGLDPRPGATLATGKGTDVLPEEGAWLAVRLPDGARAFTRDGRLVADPEGIVRAGGRPVLDARGEPLAVPPGATFTVDARGAVHSGGVEVGALGLYQLEGALERLGPGAVAPGAGGRAVPAEVPVRTGEVELSNASALEGAVQLIAAQRHFEYAMQAMQAYRRLDERASELGRVR